jgi:hypothetical protein
MYRKLEKRGAGALNKRELKLLRRESDIGVNPRGHRGHKRKNRRHFLIHDSTRVHLSNRFRYRRGRHEVHRAFRKRGYIHGRRNPRYAAPWSLKGSSLRAHWREQQAKVATTRRYARAPTARYARTNPHRDGRPTKGERRGARRRGGRFDYEPDYSGYVPRRRRRNPLGCRMSKQSMFHELKHHASRYRPQKQRVAIVLSTLRKCGRNPKRDGTPTRGELRKGKKSEYLKLIMQRGKDAEAILHRIHAVPAASKAAVAELLPQVSVAVAETPKVVAAVEHAEARFLRSRIDELGILHADLLEQIRDLGDDDVAADDAAALMEQAAKIAKQRGLIRAKAQSLGIQTNPRPRGSHGRKVLVGLRAYGVALKRLHAAIRSHR